MAGWHHRLDGHEFGWTPGVGDGQGGLACYGSWGLEESDTTERLNWTEDCDGCKLSLRALNCGSGTRVVHSQHVKRITKSDNGEAVPSVVFWTVFSKGSALLPPVTSMRNPIKKKCSVFQLQMCFLDKCRIWRTSSLWISAQSCPTLYNPMDCCVPGLPVHHQPLKPSQTHVHCISDAIQLSHPLLYPSPPAFNLSQHQSLFQWIHSSHQVANVLEFQSFQ